MVQTKIELNGLHKQFGETTAVRDVTLEINDGEFFTLLGPSGSGKTTLLRIVAGLEEPTDGLIRLNGEDVTYKRSAQREVSTVFQSYALFPHMTVRENIAYGLDIRGQPSADISERVDELLELVNLPDIGDRYPDSLSGGQQQRVALSRALAIEPEVLLLDEPLGALDEKLRKEMQIKLKEIQEEVGTTFLYVTHDQEEALTMSDRLAVMNDGNIVQQGKPEAVYNRPRTEFVARFFRGSNIFTSSVVESTDDGATLQFGSDTVSASQEGYSVSTGETVTYFVRSNNIDVGAAHANQLSGEVVEIVYHGATVEYHVDVGHETVSVLSTDDAHTIGDRIHIAWSASDTVILEESSDGTAPVADTKPVEA